MNRPNSDNHTRGLIDTNIVILRRWIDVAELPDSFAISTITLAELSAGIHEVGDGPGAAAERARRLEILQRTEHEFDALPFDSAAARIYGRIAAAVIGIGRKPRRRIADLMIASVAAANHLDVYTTNPSDYRGLEDIVKIVPVARPATVPSVQSHRSFGDY
jgi:predicted nucleic acid-binding protein